MSGLLRAEFVVWGVQSANSRPALLRIAAGALLVKARSGRYPQTLEDLKPLFPDGLPADPLTGKPFDYKLTDGLPVVRSAYEPAKDTTEQRIMFDFSELRRQGQAWRAEGAPEPAK